MKLMVEFFNHNLGSLAKTTVEADSREELLRDLGGQLDKTTTKFVKIGDVLVLSDNVASVSVIEKS